MAGGRPTDYSPETAQAVCMRIAEGESLRAVCRDEEMPCKATVLRWLGRHEEFRAQYAQAKELGIEAIAEELFEIADDGTNDWMELTDKDDNPYGYKANGEHIQRSKLRIDTRKWYLSKILPKKYGDKIQTEHSGSIDLSSKTDEELKARAAKLLAKVGGE